MLGHSGATSHAVILARSLGIPTLVGVKNARQMLTPGQEVIVDAIRGLVATRVSGVVKNFCNREHRTLDRRRDSLFPHTNRRTATTDGRVLEVGANVASFEEWSLGFENGADGIGLLRTEGLFLGRDHAPSEQDQFAMYAQAALLAAGAQSSFAPLISVGTKPFPISVFPPSRIRFWDIGACGFTPNTANFCKRSCAPFCGPPQLARCRSWRP